MKNQIDVTVSEADQSLVLQSIGSIKLAMPFLTKLSKADRKNLQMMKDGRKPFVEKGFDLASRNTDLNPGPGLIDAGNKDIKLFTFLQSVEFELQQLLEMVSDTRRMAGSEAFLVALFIYKKAKYNDSLGIPGSKAIVDELSKLFKQDSSPEAPVAAK